MSQSGELPALPEIYIRVTELLDNENSSAFQIGAALQTDPSLNARILRLINSAYYGLQNPVTSIPQAVTLFGRRQLQQILMGSVLSGVFKSFDIGGFPIHDFWRHSVKTAIIAKNLAMQNAGIIDHEAYFTAGLLHDIGWLVICKVVPDAYGVVSEIAKTQGRDVLELETEKLGVTHVEVGVALLEKWKIPSLIIQCVKLHHGIEPLEAHSVETSMVCLANQLSRFTLEDCDREFDEILATMPVWKFTNCNIEQIAIACRLAAEQSLDVMESLGMVDLEIEDGSANSYEFNTRFYQ